MSSIYDLIVIGAGPAGITAAIYAARAGKLVGIADKDGYGGQIAKSPKVENYPGFSSISGQKLMDKMFDQMSRYENIVHMMNEIVLIKYFNGLFTLYDPDNQVVCAKSVIIATGTKPRELPLKTKNLHYCTTCDGPFYKGKDVIVVGSGNTGATFALDLAGYCHHVYLCDVTMTMMCEPVLAERVKAKKSITFLPNTTILSTNNNQNGELESVYLSTLNTLPVKAIFGAAGMTPQTDFAQAVCRDMTNGYINIDENCQTKVPGLFAAGDCINKKVRQVSTAVNDGTIAAINAIKFLNSQKM